MVNEIAKETHEMKINEIMVNETISRLIMMNTIYCENIHKREYTGFYSDSESSFV